jgi:hypothetical protein
MKKIFGINLVLLFGAAFGLQAQVYEYVPLVNEDVVWSYYINNTMINEVTYLQLWINGDTVINEVAYKKVYSGCYHQPESKRYNAAVREENKKVYTYDSYLARKELIYDFGLEVGGILNEGYSDNEVLQIDTIEVDGKLRRRFVTSQHTAPIVEGIGILEYNVFYCPNNGVIPEEILKLNYQKRGDEVIFRQENDAAWFNANDCNVLGIENAGISNQIVISPNPAQNFATITGAAGKTLAVYDNIGKKIFEQKNYTDTENIAINQWAKGIYLVKITQNGVDFAVVKLVKK